MSEALTYGVSRAKVSVFTVIEWPEVDPTYNTVLIRLPGGYEARLSAVDAQRLGNGINEAGKS